MAHSNVMNCPEVVESEASRPLAHFPSDMWGDSFINFTSQDALEMERYREQIEPLREEVKRMLMDKSINPTKKMTLIDQVERLGVSYYFEDDIKELLNQLYEHATRSNNNFNHIDNGSNNSLYDTALQFRIFRQHGYNIPSDVFSKFMNKEGKFKKTTKSDIKGMICLYEATHLRIHGDYILDEALDFTTNYLKSNSTSYNQQFVHHALKHPLHKSIPRIETRLYISLYQDDETRNETLLQFAKLDFNRLQLLYQQELCQILRWWKDLDLVTKLPYARNGWVESHFTAMAMLFEPQYSFARELLTKVTLMAFILDDSYDAYGTFEELQLLTNAFERWDLTATDEFPVDYMKLVYNFVLTTCDEFDKALSKREKPYAAQFIKDRMKDLIRSYYVQTKWLNARYVPTFDEYMLNGRISALAPILISSSLMGMEEIRDTKPFEQKIMQAPKAMRACEIICRLMNDIGTHQEEQTRPHNASSVECYMKDNDMSREAAVQSLYKMVDNALKDINEELLKRTSFEDHDHLPLPILKPVLNLARLVLFCYEVGIDSFTHSFKFIKDDIIATYVCPIAI